MFADDIALVAESAKDMETLLNVVEEYLDLKGLEFKKKKTVIVVFWKGGKLRKDDESRLKVILLRLIKNSCI